MKVRSCVSKTVLSTFRNYTLPRIAERTYVFPASGDSFAKNHYHLEIDCTIDGDSVKVLDVLISPLANANKFPNQIQTRPKAVRFQTDTQSVVSGKINKIQFLLRFRSAFSGIYSSRAPCPPLSSHFRILFKAAERGLGSLGKVTGFKRHCQN